MNISFCTYAFGIIFMEACFTGAVKASFCVGAVGMRTASSVVDLTFVEICTVRSVNQCQFR